MKMKHRLTGDTAVVGKKIETFQPQSFDKRRGDDPRRIQNVRIAFRLKIEKIPEVFSWDDQRVTKVDGVDVEDGHNVVIFEEDFGRHFSRHDPAEHALTHEPRGEFPKLMMKNLFKITPKVKGGDAGGFLCISNHVLVYFQAFQQAYNEHEELS